MAIELERQFIRAIADGKLDKCRQMLNDGVDPNCVSDFNYKTVKYGMTALMCAIGIDQSGMSILVDAKADIDVDTEKYGTALDYALMVEKESAAVQLIRLGANVNTSRRAITLAILKNADEAFDLLLETGVEINFEANERHLGNIPLIQACHLNRFKYIERLIEYGANVDVCDRSENGFTPLHILSIRDIGEDNAYLIGKLMANGADAAKVDDDGDPAIYYALQSQSNDSDEDRYYFSVLKMLAEPLDHISQDVLKEAEKLNNGSFDILMAIKENKVLSRDIMQSEDLDQGIRF